MNLIKLMKEVGGLIFPCPLSFALPLLSDILFLEQVTICLYLNEKYDLSSFLILGGE